jgi:hypothetical protein
MLTDDMRVTGICVPAACTAADLSSKKILQPLMNLGVTAALNVSPRGVS